MAYVPQCAVMELQIEKSRIWGGDPHLAIAFVTEAEAAGLYAKLKAQFESSEPGALSPRNRAVLNLSGEGWEDG